MTLRTCPCGSLCTTRNSKPLGRLDSLLWFNCPSCDSTFVVGPGFLHMKLILLRQKGLLESLSLAPSLERFRRNRLTRAILAPLEERWALEEGSDE